MLSLHIPSGMDLRKARELARKLNCEDFPVNRTGERRVSHPLMPKPVTYNARKSNAPRKLTCFLRELVRKLAA